MNYEVILEMNGFTRTLCLFKTKKLANAYIEDNYSYLGSEYDLENTLSSGYVNCTGYNFKTNKSYNYMTYITECYDDSKGARIYVRKLTK